MVKEKEIENFLARNLYLINKQFANAKAFTQTYHKGNRLDILIQLGEKYSIVEIKRGYLHTKSYEQLIGYIKSWSKNYKLRNTHYLIGAKPIDSSQLPKQKKSLLINGMKYKIKTLFLGSDIPLRYLYNLQTRRYVPYDEEYVHKKEIYCYPLSFDIM